jgi:hypothetical protein
MNGTHIGDFFPELYNQALRFGDTVTPVAFLLVLIGIIVAGTRGLQGDIQAMWGGLSRALVICILIATLPDIVNGIQLASHALVQETGADPSKSSEKFGSLIVGKSESDSEEVGFMDILFHDRGGLGKAILFAMLMMVSFVALVIQYIFFVIQQVLVIYGIALGGVFLAMFMVDSLKSIATKYFLGLVAILIWPVGWALGDIVTTALLERAAGTGVHGEGISGFASTGLQSLFLAVVVSVWLLITTIGFPLLINQIVTAGANVGSLILQRMSTALGFGASYAMIGGTTAAMTDGSKAAVAASTVAGAIGGTVSGAVGSSGSMLLPTIIGLSAAKGSIGSRAPSPSGDPDYNAEAAKISKSKKQ